MEMTNDFSPLTDWTPHSLLSYLVVPHHSFVAANQREANQSKEQPTLIFLTF
jgi:hypothetical protein